MCVRRTMGFTQGRPGTYRHFCHIRYRSVAVLERAKDEQFYARDAKDPPTLLAHALPKRGGSYPTPSYLPTWTDEWGTSPPPPPKTKAHSAHKGEEAYGSLSSAHRIRQKHRRDSETTVAEASPKPRVARVKPTVHYVVHSACFEESLRRLDERHVCQWSGGVYARDAKNTPTLLSHTLPKHGGSNGKGPFVRHEAGEG